MASNKQQSGTSILSSVVMHHLINKVGRTFEKFNTKTPAFPYDATVWASDLQIDEKELNKCKTD